jgi:hypothetical protein
VTDPIPPSPSAPGDEPPPAAPEVPRTTLPVPPDTRTVTLTLRQVPASQGLRWLKEGAGIFFRRPLALTGLFAMFLFLALVAMLLPLIGPVLLLGALPLVSLAFMLATQAIVGDRFPMPGIAAAPLRTDRPRRIALLQLGFAYALASFLIMAVSDAADGGKFAALQDAMSRGSEGATTVGALMGDGQLAFGLAVRLGLAVLLAVPFWHAPALVHWGGQGVLQSLFSSTVAVWRNRGAFLMYGVGWGLALAGFATAGNLLALMLGAPQVISLVMMPAALMMTTVFYASLYFTFVDSFGRRDAD